MKTNIQTTIRNYLQQNGVNSFWVESAMNYIERLLAGNRHFIVSVSSPKIVVTSGYVASFKCKAVASIPDLDKAVNVVLKHNFNPSKKIAHKASVEF